MSNHSWTAFLSDGRSINEKELYAPGDILPFKKLVKKCVAEKVEITSLTINVNGIRYNSPSKSQRGNFTSTVGFDKFWVSYRDRILPMQDMNITFVSMSWRIGDYRTTMWVSLNSEKPISWFEIREANDRQEEIIDLYYSGGSE